MGIAGRTLEKLAARGAMVYTVTVDFSAINKGVCVSHFATRAQAVKNAADYTACPCVIGEISAASIIDPVPVALRAFFYLT